MTEQLAPESVETDNAQEQQPKPTETVDFWKQKAREQEKRAKENADARKRLDELENANKTEAEKAAEAETSAIPAKVAEALKSHLIALHEIDADDAELFLTATDPELLLKQVGRLTARGSSKKSNHVPREGNTPTPGHDEEREAARSIFGG